MNRMAVSGTYSSGKTTTTYALSFATGIPRTHALTMREILPDALPGKRLEECSGPEILQLGVRRLTERIARESRMRDGFISDGSALHEWVYGIVRADMGINPAEAVAVSRGDAHELAYFREILQNYGEAVKAYARGAYDVFIHLPVEFPLAADGHRPVSEPFRHACDALIQATVNELGLPQVAIGGTLEERVDAIIDALALPRQMATSQAVAAARDSVGRLNQLDELDRATRGNSR